ncbi:MAG: MoxR family ATPase [Planctomycetes bacterium]|nr:MoxR family ATPase [Planctomycetota bacterium]
MSDVEAVEKLKEAHSRLLREMHKVIVGQEEIVEQLLIALFCRGHCLMVGVPGLAKTLMVSTLSRILALKFNRVQFTPDLMPSDITGTDVMEEDEDGKRQFRFVPGPLFANIVLADEINRTPPKTQAALLEAMQERQVTAGGRKYPLDPPFFVLATQNPIEQEGTYPLPEAQLDRFMFNIYVGYPDIDDEKEIVRSTTIDLDIRLDPVMAKDEILDLQALVRRVPVSDHVIEYAVNLARATRPEDPSSPEFVKEYLSWGAGPRAGQYLILAAKASAVLAGKVTPSVEDIANVAVPVLRHRLVTNFTADSEGVSSAEVVQRLLKETPSAAET